ncbi:MAG: helix-turn-helix domain-containing protein [Acidobacteriota bacterium]
MASLGQQLRDERLRQGRAIGPIADDLRIGSRYLEAIEAEQWDLLPGGFFNRSFVRQYAQALGLNGQQFENQYNSILGSHASVDLEAIGAARDPRARLLAERKLISLAPVTDKPTSFFDGRTGLAVAALVVLIAGGGLVSLLWDNLRGAETARAAVADRPMLQPAVPAQPAAAPPAQLAVSPVTTAAATSAESFVEGVISLNIAATEKTWLEVTADGKRIFMGVLEPGQSQSMRTSESARMVVGNAGGITVQKAGRDIGPIGPRGQVRVVNLTKDQVEILEPNRPAPAKPAGEV